MNGINDCYYSEGSKHKCCTHQHYCIFNSKRIELEEQLQIVVDEFRYYKKQLNNLRSGEYYTPHEYNEIKQKLTILKLDLKQLRLFQLKVINGEIEGYGVQSN